MEYKINETPFKMDQIVEKLFNSQYLSDVTFIVDGQFIYAHSLVLMVRSSVFQIQLEPHLGENKIIPITDYGYNEFYQLIRFIYTDKCASISGVDHLRLIKLANAYNVIRLVNHLVNDTFEIGLSQLNFCITEHHNVGLNILRYDLADRLRFYLDSNEFLLLHPDAVEDILKFDRVKGTTEKNLLDAVIHWMNHYCKENHMEFSQCRQKFDHLIRLVRFPTMSNSELRNIKIDYPDLLTKSDLMIIGSYTIFGSDLDDGLFNCSPRMRDFVSPYTYVKYPDVYEFVTKFSVSTDMVLVGFVVGCNFGCLNGRLDIKISYEHRNWDQTTELNINDVVIASRYNIIDLGASICVRPDYIYTIACKYDDKSQLNNCMSRKPQFELIPNAPANTVDILEAHATMLDISFLESN